MSHQETVEQEKATPEPEAFEPKIVAFLCNWCSYTAADLAGTSRLKYPPNVRVVRVMCSSRVDATLVLDAFLRGADGVLIGGCHPGDCHYQTGNYYERRKIAMLRRILEANGLDRERVHLTWIAASEGPAFAQEMAEFTEKMRTLGRNSFAGGYQC